MLDSKVVESVKALSEEEKAEFDQFLLSPYFQRGFTVEEIRHFYNLILQALVNDPENEFQKMPVHHLLFSDKPYSESRMDRIMFELNRLVQVFLLSKNYHRKENEVQRVLDWSEIQRKRNQPANVEKQLQKLLEKLEEEKSSVEIYWEKFQIANEAHDWSSTFNRMKGDLGIPEAIRSLDLFYYAQRLSLLNVFLLQQKGATLPIPEVIQRALNAETPPEYYLQESPLLLITQKIQDLFQQNIPEPDGFQALISLLEKHQNTLAPDTLYNFYAYLRNYCTILIDAGMNEFEALLHEIQKDNLKRGYFYHEGHIHPNAVLNMTMLALRLNNIAWARNFLEAHKNIIIGENETHDYYRMNIAACLFAEKQFEESLACIPYGSTNASYHLMARRLELKIYYELNSELLPSKIDAFKMFVSRAGNKSLSANWFELLTNFGNFVHQLSLSIPGDKKRSEQLINRIQAKKLVGERGWLLEKAKALGEAKKI